ncbi:MAG: hypothetical protein WCB79_02625, partial [Halobacteriota archaeon]
DDHERDHNAYTEKGSEADADDTSPSLIALQFVRKQLGRPLTLWQRRRCLGYALFYLRLGARPCQQDDEIREGPRVVDTRVVRRVSVLHQGMDTRRG